MPMTEAEWTAATAPYDMLKALEERAGVRKLILFAVACVERVRHLFHLPKQERVIDLAWEHAEKRVSTAQRKAICSAGTNQSLGDRCGNHALFALRLLASLLGGRPRDGRVRAANGIAGYVAGGRAYEGFYASGYNRGVTPAYDTPPWNEAKQAEELLHAHLVRDLFDPVFWPVSFDPAWRDWNDGTISKVAQAIYDEQAFDRMPILADALEDAGCTDALLLGHCRSAPLHTRGCWLVDLVLNKK
jgi:hypothetical protein